MTSSSSRAVFEQSSVGPLLPSSRSGLAILLPFFCATERARGAEPTKLSIKVKSARSTDPLSALFQPLLIPEIFTFPQWFLVKTKPNAQVQGSVRTLNLYKFSLVGTILFSRKIGHARDFSIFFLSVFVRFRARLKKKKKKKTLVV